MKKNKIIVVIFIISLLILEYIIIDAFLISGWILCSEGHSSGYLSNYNIDSDLTYLRRYDKCKLNGPYYTFRNNKIQDYYTYVDSRLAGISIHFDAFGNYSCITDWRKKIVYFQLTDSLKYEFNYDNKMLTQFYNYNEINNLKIDVIEYEKYEEVFFEKISNKYFLYKTYQELKIYDTNLEPYFELTHYIDTLNNNDNKKIQMLAYTYEYKDNAMIINIKLRLEDKIRNVQKMIRFK